MKNKVNEPAMKQTEKTPDIINSITGNEIQQQGIEI